MSEKGWWRRVVGIVTRLQAGQPGIWVTRQERESSLFSKICRQVVELYINTIAQFFNALHVHCLIRYEICNSSFIGHVSILTVPSPMTETDVGSGVLYVYIYSTQ